MAFKCIPFHHFCVSLLWTFSHCFLLRILFPPHLLHHDLASWKSSTGKVVNPTGEKLVVQSCPTLCNPIDCSLPGSSVHGILQATILEWVPMPFSRGSSQSRDWTQVSCTAGGFFTLWVTREQVSNQELSWIPSATPHMILLVWQN